MIWDAEKLALRWGGLQLLQIACFAYALIGWFFLPVWLAFSRERWEYALLYLLPPLLFGAYKRLARVDSIAASLGAVLLVALAAVLIVRYLPFLFFLVILCFMSFEWLTIYVLPAAREEAGDAQLRIAQHFDGKE